MPQSTQHQLSGNEALEALVFGWRDFLDVLQPGEVMDHVGPSVLELIATGKRFSGGWSVASCASSSSRAMPKAFELFIDRVKLLRDLARD